MAWNPFKKAFSTKRTTSEDVEFEREVTKLKQVQAVNKRMYKDMKKCNETETVYFRCKQHLINGVKSSPSSRTESLKSVAEDLGTNLQSVHIHSRELKANQDNVFIDPMKRLNSVYKQVELHAKQREQKLQDYERQQLKMEKQGRKATSLSQTQGGNQSKLDLSHRALASARTDYERIHDRLMQEIPQLLEGRVDYFDTCLFAVIKAQSLYYSECSDTSLSCLRSLDNCGESIIRPEEEVQQSTFHHLEAIRGLSIVGS